MRKFCTLILLFGAIAASASNRPACEALATAGLFKNTVVQSVQVVTRDSLPGSVAHCEVRAVVSPVAGSRIGVIYRLPDAWNDKLLGLGGAGWAGDIRFAASQAPLARGYVTAQSDGGHESAELWDPSWAARPVAVADFGWRAIHQMTLLGKDLIARYYGRAQTRAFFQGCSTGGRQGLIEAQRFADDYDGVVAGAPVQSLLTQTSQLLRTLAFRAPGAALTPGQLVKLNEASLAACDGLDGLEDGIVTDPRACSFDPSAVACSADVASPDCLSPAQVLAVRAIYSRVTTTNGGTAAYPILPGDEAGWMRFIDVGAEQELGVGAQTAGLKNLRETLLKDRDFDLASFDPDKDLATVRGSPFAAQYEAVNPDLSAFVERGGKLILWHGFDDPGPSPLETLEYYEAAQAALGERSKLFDAPVRLFLAPGVEHCGGGRGANTFDPLRALEDWVERKDPPESMRGTRADGKLSRPICRYPALPRYKGSGDPNDAANFTCR
ncbi:MAG TPA: tannase/feruloyl esterase family alpha/beta hydrolase [Steroidobacteraceae bacterium]|nr:tannase/feruloyl esterase family alpha/beta hydrolase [Steroidobacteraceae bacterium]